MALPQPRMKMIEGRGMRLAYEFACKDCRRSFVVEKSGTTKNRPDNEDSLWERRCARNLQNEGWETDRHFKKIQCPACIEIQARKARQARQAKAEELFSAPISAPIAPAEEQGIMAKSAISAASMAISVPSSRSSSTPADRRRISDELDNAYNVEAGLYFGRGSDQQIAEKLKVPIDWVREVREFTYGESGESELENEIIRKANDLEIRIRIAEDKIEAAMSEISVLRAEMAALLPKKEGAK